MAPVVTHSAVLWRLARRAAHHGPFRLAGTLVLLAGVLTGTLYQAPWTLGTRGPAAHAAALPQPGSAPSFAAPAAAPAFGQQQELTVAGAPGRVGDAAALSSDGNTALIGAGNTTGPGAAYVFARGGGTWSEQAALAAFNGPTGGNFGSAVALSGDGNTALIGAYSMDSPQGAAYVFVRKGSAWLPLQKLTATGAPSNGFGFAVALNGNGTIALIGALDNTVGTNLSQGAAYVFTLSESGWSQQAEITATNGAASDNFGAAAALSSSGATALIGAPYGGNAGEGAAYVFVGGGSSWSQQAALSGGAAGDGFGYATALSGDGATAIIGAPFRTVAGAANEGAAYVFVGAGGTWSQKQDLAATDGAASNFLGVSAALDGTGATAIIGASGKNGQGAAYVFAQSGGGWSQQEVTAGDGAANDAFGFSAALSGDGSTALIGATGKNSGQGAAYVFVQGGGAQPTATPTATASSTTTAVATDTATNTPIPPTATDSSTPTNTPTTTTTNTATATNTPVPPTDTATNTPTPTPIVVATGAANPGSGGTISGTTPAGETVGVQMPPGAVSTPVTVTILAFPTPPNTPPAGGAMFLGNEVDLSAVDGAGNLVTQFAQPVTISFSFPAGTNPALLVIAFFDTVTGTWQNLPTTVDTVNHIVTATTTHFTHFAVIQEPTPTATATNTPTRGCTLSSAPLFSSVGQAEVQAIDYAASKPNTTLTAAFSTGSLAYPAKAALLVVRANRGVRVTNVTGTLVNGQYQYAFNDGPVGQAALGFLVPAAAHLGISKETGTCGGPSTTLSWTVTRDHGDDQHDLNTDGVMPTGKAPDVGATGAAHSWTFTLDGRKETFTYYG